MDNNERVQRKKKTKIPLGVFAVVLLFILYSPLVYGETLEEGIITAECLNVRQDPNISATILGQLSKDSDVKINEFSNDWFNVTYGDVTGWVFGDYVTVKGASTPVSNAPVQSGDNTTGVVTASVLNVREGVGTTTKVAAQLENGMEVKILGEDDANGEFSWYNIEYTDIKGWVSGEYISFKNEPVDEGTINVAVANVREGPSLTSNVTTQLKKSNKVIIYSWYSDWYKIKLEDGNFAWVFADLVTTGKALASRGNPNSRGGSDRIVSLTQQVVNYAKKYLGVKYVWAGTSPSGFDCSGFVQYVYNHFGIKLNRVAADQARQGTQVSRAQLRAGDLVFFNTSSGGGIDHVGMYIGNNQFIHAASGRGKVLIDPLNQGYYNGRLVASRRMIK